MVGFQCPVLASKFSGFNTPVLIGRFIPPHMVGYAQYFRCIHNIQFKYITFSYNIHDSISTIIKTKISYTTLCHIAEINGDYVGNQS